MSSAPAGSDAVKKYGQKAVNTLSDAGQAQQSDPLFQMGQQAAQYLLNNYMTMDPETVAKIKGTAIDQAQQAANGSFNQLAERSGQTGSFRDSSQGRGQRSIALGLGDTIGNINRQTDVQAAQQLPIDTAHALDVMNSILSSKYGYQKDIANAYLGIGASPVWGNPSPLSSAFGAVGSIGGGLLGTALAPATGGTSLSALRGLFPTTGSLGYGLGWGGA